MLGLQEAAYDMNAIGNTVKPEDNITAIRHLGPEIAAEFQWRLENRHNILWRSRSLAEHYHGKNGRRRFAPIPKTPTEITDPKAINMWCYLLGRMRGDTLITGFKWRDMGAWTIDSLVLEEMGSKPRTYNTND